MTNTTSPATPDAGSGVVCTIISPVSHDGIDYAPGATLTLAPGKAAELAACGALEPA